MIVFILLLCCLSNASLLHLRALLSSHREVHNVRAVPTSPDATVGVESPLPPPIVIGDVMCPPMECWPLATAECFYQGAAFDDQGCQLTCGTYLCPLSCREDQEWSAGNFHCQRRCDDPNPPCTRMRAPGCVCKSGLWLLGDSCVTPVECPVNPCPIIDCLPPTDCFYQDRTFDDRGCQVTCGTLSCPHSCPVDQEWSDCNAHCQRECNSPDPMFCSRMCVSGCVCKSGLVLLDGSCVYPGQCPVAHGCQGDGQVCGGFAAIQCAQGSTCVNDGTIPDGSGICRCNVDCPIMDCFGHASCFYRDPTWDQNGCQTSCGTLLCPQNDHDHDDDGSR